MTHTGTVRLNIEDLRDAKRRQILTELLTASRAVQDSRSTLEAAEAQYEMSLSRFKTAYKFLESNLTELGAVHGHLDTVPEYLMKFKGLGEHCYVALPIGEAIEALLKHRAGEKLGQRQIIYHLGGGGFQFRSTSPSREVHAALLRLKGIQKDGIGNFWVEPPEPDEDAEQDE